MKTLSIALALAASLGLAPAAPAFAQAQIAGRTAQTQDTAEQERPARTMMLQRAQIQSRVTPVERRIYENASTQMSSGDATPEYSCEHDSAGNPTSCWCNWNSDANDCKDMILNQPCGGDGAWWTSDVEGEYGCDRQSSGE